MYREKARIPAWTDRILRKGSNLRQIDYNVAQNLRFSDHRPVYATFQCVVSIVNEAMREALSHEIYEARRSDVGSSTAIGRTVDSDDEDIIGYDPIEPGLPPASSDKRKWWLDNGKPARSEVKPPQDGAVPNPNRPSNPFTPTDEPDWVTVPRMPLHRTPSQSTSTLPPPPNPRPANAPRKLPPPYDPSVASLGNNFSQASLQEASSPQNQPPRSVKSANSRRDSLSSTTSKKSAPPVGRKPVHLTSSPTLSASSLSSQTRSPQPFSKSPQSTGSSVFPPPPRRSIAASTAMGDSTGLGGAEYKKDASFPPPPPQPRRSGAANGSGLNSNAVYRVDQTPRPGLPPRPIRDLLGDEDDELKGWEALKPT